MKKALIFALTVVMVCGTFAFAALTATCTPDDNDISNDQPPAAVEAATVYMTTDISPEGLQAVYEALGVAPVSENRVAVKVTTGEPPSSNYLRQDLIGAFVRSLKPERHVCRVQHGVWRTAGGNRNALSSRRRSRFPTHCAYGRRGRNGNPRSRRFAA